MSARKTRLKSSLKSIDIVEGRSKIDKLLKEGRLSRGRRGVEGARGYDSPANNINFHS